MRQRVKGGQLTGLKLSQQTGFQQAHISNFLNSKRSLSLEASCRRQRGSLRTWC
jgi:hypothetical protein